MEHEVRLPEIGEGQLEGEVLNINIKPGDWLKFDQEYMDIQTDKAVISLVSTFDGEVISVKVEVGGIVNVGDVLLCIDTDLSSKGIRKRELYSNIRTGFNFLSKKNASYLCCRVDLGKYNFSNFLPEIDQILIAVREFQDLSLDNANKDIIEEVMTSVYDVSSVIKEIESFKPKSAGHQKRVAHRRVILYLKAHCQDALTKFIESYWPLMPIKMRNKYEEKAGKQSKIFIIHGHDNELKREVQLLMTKAGLENVILHECPDRGRTVIHKLIQESTDAKFSIALLSPDDVTKDKEFRARQNVILEIGYFIGKLGNSKVMLLKKGNVNIPTDLAGLLYKKYDGNGVWKADVLNEIKDAGIEINPEKFRKAIK